MTETYSLFFYFFVFSVGFILGRIIFYCIDTYLNKTNITHNQKENVTIRYVPMLKTEIHDGQIYLFDIDTDIFISQGNSLEEIALTAYKHKKIDMALVLYNNQYFLFVNGKSTLMNKHELNLQNE